jgi:uncharacterized protein with GYD domain
MISAYKEVLPMPKFLIQGTYAAEGLRALAKDKASGRQAVVKEALASLGGKLEGADHVSAAALSLAVSASGLVRTKTIPLLTVEETDRALAMKTGYRAPGASKAAKA